MAVEGGCKWNNDLSHEIFEENVGKFGKEKALQLLRNDVKSWVRERDGKKFDFSYRIKDGQLVNEELGKSMTGMIEDSINGPHVSALAANIRENAPLELATAQEATRRAVRGDKEIKILEFYRTEDGNIVIRYFTVLTEDAREKGLYHGNRIDLGQNFSVKEALKKAGEKVVMPVKNTGIVVHKSGEVCFSATHVVLGELPRETARIVTGTAAEFVYTARSVARYIEKRKEKNTEKTKRKSNPKSVDIWKRIAESGKRRMRRMAGEVKYISELKHIRERKQNGVLQKNKSVEKSITRHERKVLRIKLKTERRHPLVVRKERRVVFVHKPEKRRSAMERLFVKKMITTRESISVKKREHSIRLISFVRKLIRIKERMIGVGQKKPENVRKKFVEKARRVYEHVADFTTAVIFWILLTGRKNVLTNEYKKGKKETKLVKREPTPWLLLAIIWHLAMIREMGALTTRRPKQKKVKKTVHYPRFSPRGVIFAYAT